MLPRARIANAWRCVLLLAPFVNSSRRPRRLRHYRCGLGQAAPTTTPRFSCTARSAGPGAHRARCPQWQGSGGIWQTGGGLSADSAGVPCRWRVRRGGAVGENPSLLGEVITVSAVQNNLAAHQVNHWHRSLAAKYLKCRIPYKRQCASKS